VKRAEPLHALTYRPRGYCREGHPVAERTMLGSVGDLTPINLPHDQTEVLHRQSLEIFTLMANSGRSFADCLSAILLTGMHWGSEIAKEKR
jgi:hypothetical protein